MTLSVVKVASGGLPITQAPAGLGYPCVVSTNGYGVAVTVVTSGGMGVNDATPGGGLFSGITLSGSTFLAGSAAGTAIGTFSVSGGSGTYVYTLTDSASNKVQVAGTNGVNLQVGSAASAASSFSITVQTTGGSPNFTQTFLITALPIPPSGGVPTISGSTVIGNLLTATTGTWAGSAPITYAYQWKRGAVNVGSNTNTYTSAVADIGSTITVTVTATNGGGSASATSAATAAITGSAPVNTFAPVISGSPVEGQVLITTTGTWTGTPTPTFTYEWKRISVTVGTSSSYTLVTADVGFNISCIVTGTNIVGNAAALSNSLGPVTALGAMVAPTIDLAATSDFGLSFTDNITNDNTPEFDVLCGVTPLVGDVIDIAKDGVIVTSVTLTTTDIDGTTVPSLGTTPVTDGTYVFTARQTQAGVTSAYSSGLSVTIDTVAPTLSSPSGIQNAGNQANADLSVTTNESNGRIYWVVTPATMAAPTPTQIINHMGSDGFYVPAGKYNNFSVSTTGAKTATATGFAVGTVNYKVHWTHTDVAGNNAATSSSAQWTQTVVVFNANGIGGFDGSTTYLSNTALASSIAAGQQGLISFWVKVLGGASTDRYVFEIFSGSTIKFWLHFSAANVVEVLGRDAVGNTRLTINNSVTGNPFASGSIPNTAWQHVAFWWDLSLATPAGGVYLNGASATSGSPIRDATSPIAYNQTSAFIGSQHAPSLKFNGSLSELYINLHETLDLSDPTSLFKFRDSGGNPVSLGSTGLLPTGTQPEFYLGGTNNNTTWQNNLGSKGNFTVAAGALTSVTGPP